MDEDTLVPGVSGFAGSINFSPSITLSPSWNSDSTVLTMESDEFLGLFIPGTQYTWTFNPAGAFFTLTSTGGEALGMRTGTFKIAAGSGGGGVNTPACNPTDILSDADGPSVDFKCYGSGDPGGTNRTTGSMFVSRQLSYTQFSPGAPKPLTPTSSRKPFEFQATVLAEPNVTLSAATITPQGKSAIALVDAGFEGIFDFSQGFDTLAGLDAAYPSSSYKFSVVGNTGSKSGSVNMPSSGGIIPEITNLTEAQTVDTTAPFVLKWKPFSSSGANPSLTLTIQGFCTKKIVFFAPNICVPIQLKPTDTSIVIPGNTLRPNRRYRGRLSYNNGDYSTSTVPGYVLGSSVNSDTEFPINDPEASDPGASGGSRPILSLSSDLSHVLVSATLGQAFSLYSSTDLVTWSKLSTGTGLGATPAPLLIVLPKVHHQYYRATSP